MSEQSAPATEVQSIYNYLDKAAFSLGASIDHTQPADWMLEELGAMSEATPELAMAADMVDEALDYMGRAEFLLLTALRSAARQVGMEGIVFLPNQTKRLHAYLELLDKQYASKEAKAKKPKAKKKGFTTEAA